VAKFKISQSAEALSDFSKAVTIDKDFVDAWFNRALVEIELNDHKSALADLDKLLAIRPDHKKGYEKRQELRRLVSE
jgi:tetratricopeptide (TPR) repeat protein